MEGLIYFQSNGLTATMEMIPNKSMGHHQSCRQVLEPDELKKQER